MLGGFIFGTGSEQSTLLQTLLSPCQSTRFPCEAPMIRKKCAGFGFALYRVALGELVNQRL